MKSSFTVAVCLLYLQTVAQPPVITSFSPISAAVGTTVIINGANFNPTPAANTVYFGAVKATVTSASANSLNVTVPTGATYQPITVTTNNLTASANGSFAVTFPSNPVGITTNSFAPKTDFVSGYDPEVIAACDLDGDGKTDLVTVNQSSGNISVFRNTGSSGVVSFAAKVDYATPGTPLHIATGDLDGDGKPDLVVANNGTGAVSVFKNTSVSGTISFAAKADFTAKSGANCTAIGDLDGDGKPDLVVSSSGGITSSVLKNTSTGGIISFGMAVDLFTFYTKVALSDFDGDGKLDLVGNAGGPLVSVFRNTSSGGSISFGPRLDFTTANSNSTIGVGDLDGDGKPDVAVASSTSVVSVLRNTSSGTTISFAAYLNFATGNNARGLTMGDLDGDGKPDIAATNSGGATVSVLKNNSVSGTIAFAGKVDYATGMYPYSVAIADMDGDGKPDLSVANHSYTTSNISVFKNQTDGPNITSFTPANAIAGSTITITGTFFTGATAVSIGGVAATSFTIDNDGQITAVVPGVVGGSVVVNTPNGSASLGGFYNGPTITSVSPVTGPLGTSVTIGGTNFSSIVANNTVYVGAVKAAVSSATSTTINITIPAGTTYEPIKLTTGARTAYSAQAFTTTFPANATGLTANSFVANGNGTSSEAIGDLDGDGKPDYVTYSTFVTSINISRNISTAGATSFNAISLTATTNNINSVALGDLDGDGKLDIAITYYYNDIVSIFKNTSTSGNLSFAARQDISTGAGRPVVSIGDIDGDGKPDLALAAGGSSIVSLLRNISTGGTIAFAPKTDVSINSVNRVTLGDLNADGKPEMVVANYYANTVSVLRNTSVPGVLSFAAQIDYATGSVPTAVVIADLNSDGKPDLAVTNQGASTVSVLKNESSGGSILFGAATNFATGVGPTAVSAADVDGDGKPDLAVANGTAYTLSVLKNTTAGSTINFAPKLDFITGANIIHTSTADYDGDGRPDIAVTGSILLNKTAGTDIFSVTPSNAAAGTSAVISGINFTGAMAVSFGGVAASSFTVNSDVQITATVAAVAGGKVSVTTPKGTATLNGFYNGPAITSFSPASGPVGTTVTISGTNFNTTPSANTVYFGAVKAVVSAATATSLTVTVPVGATYQPLSVTAGNYTGYSVKPFIATFPSAATGFNAASFTTKVDFAAGSNPACVATGDFDGDGKPDMVVSNSTTGYLSVYKNTGSPGTVSFGTRLDMGNGFYPTNITTGDINGDGKLDIIVIFYNSTSVYVYRNTTVGSTISFASEVSIYTGIGTAPRQVIVTDLDGDGKPDMAVANSGPPSTAIIFRNTSTLTTISFAPKQEIAAAGGSSYSLAASDFDGDGKPELALTDYTFYGSGVVVVAVFKNLSQPGNILFDGKKDFITGYNNKSVSIGDLDGDGKADLVITNIYTNDIAVLRNTTTAGNISFASAVSYPTGTAPYCVSISDMDGDGALDLAIANSGAATVSLYRNQSTPGTLSFAARQDYATGVSPWYVAITDLDGDGKPDLATANYDANTFSVLRNQVGAPNITSFTPGNAAVGTTLTINGTAFTGTTAVSIGGIAATSFTVVNDGQITATVAAVAGGNISVTTPAGTASLAGFYNGPVITSFSPTSGPIGTTVTITGTAFSATAISNIVYFGAVKAVVSAASATSLTVTVPVGATYQPPTVTTGNLTAYAAKPFTVTFPATSGFTAGSFAPKVDVATATGPYSTAASDFDGDGKPDIAVANGNSNSVSVLRNTGTSGSVSFAAKVDFVAGTAPGNITAGDIDGDGKPDLAVTSYTTGTVSVFKNLSTSGVISFAAKVDYPTGTGPVKVRLADVNADGKPDLIVVNSANSGSVVSVYKNTSVGGVISFAVRMDFLNERYLRGVAIGDFDNDGKPDIAITYESDYKFSVVRNTSANGIISFASKTDVTTTGNSYSLDVADLDGDGKDDIAFTNYTLNLISFFRNTTAGSAISFAPKVDVATAVYAQGIAFGDLDGDGKPDVTIANYSFGTNTLSVLKNTSSSGAIAFAAKADYTTGASPISLSVADADGDGKPDLFAANYNSNNVSVLRNLLALPDPCVGGSISYTSNLSGTSYQWQVNTGSGFTNITDNSNYSGTATATLQLTNLPSAWYGYQYRCVVDGVNSNVFTLEFKNTWTGAVSSAWEVAANWSCGVVPDANTDVILNTGTVMISSAAVCRSLKPGTGATITVAAGYSLLVAK